MNEYLLLIHEVARCTDNVQLYSGPFLEWMYIASSLRSDGKDHVVRWISEVFVRVPYDAWLLVWVSNAVLRPTAKRSAAMGIVNGFGNLGNLYVVIPIVCLDSSRIRGWYD